MGRQTFLPIEILDYIQTHERPADELYGISQQELARSLGYHPSSMSRPLSDLLGRGMISESRGLVRGGRRKHIVYRLTPAGLTHLTRETRDVPLLGRGLPPPPSPFLGRREELEVLGKASVDPASVVVVEGPAGIGKTALLTVHLRKIQRGRIVFWYPIRATSSSRDFVSGLAHALTFSGNPQLAYYAQLPRNPVAREVADLAARAIGRHPLCAVLDDFHLASEDLRMFLGDFIDGLRSRGAHQFYLVGQSVTLPAVLLSAAQRLLIGGLDRASAFELAGREGGLADRFEEVYRSALGSPLLIKLAASNPNLEAPPATLPTAVVRQLAPADLRAVVPAALANEPLPKALIAEEFHVPPAKVEELARIGVLQKRGDDRVEILEIARTAVLARVSAREEREAHLLLARYYGRSRRPEAIRERFFHLVAGEDLTASFHLLEDHQQELLRLGYSEGLRRALRHLSGGLPRGPSRTRVLMADAALSRVRSDFVEAIATLRRAVAECEPRSPLATEARLKIVEAHIRLGQVREASDEFEVATRGGLTTRRLKAFARFTEARLQEARGENAAAFELFRTAFELAKSARAQDLVLEAIAWWSNVAVTIRGAGAALRLVEEALPQARRADRIDVVLNLLLVRSRAYTYIDRLDLAEADMKAVQAEAESLGYLNHLASTLSGLAAIEAEAQRWQEASGYARQAMATAERIGNDHVLGHTLAVTCAMERRQAAETHDAHLLQEALAHGERSIEVLSRLGPSESLILAYAYMTEVLIDLHATEKARAHYEAALSIAGRTGSGFLQERIRAEFGARLGLEAKVAAPEPAPPPASGEAEGERAPLVGENGSSTGRG